MKKTVILTVILAIMIIPSIILITDSEDSTADTSASVTPTGSATASTLSYLSKGAYYTETYAEVKYINWQLDITVPRTYTYGATINVSVMQSMASSIGISSASFQAIDTTDSYQRNSAISNGGITTSYGFNDSMLRYESIEVSGSAKSMLGDYSYSNSYVSNYSSNRWMVHTTNGMGEHVLNFISIIVHVQPRTYNITYDPNGGTFASQPQTTYIENTVVTLPTNISRANYTFVGWYNSSNQQVTQVTMNGDVSVQARWDYNYRELTYVTDGGVFAAQPQTTFFRGTVVTLATDISKANYTFVGWYNSNNQLVTQVTMSANTTVYAHWDYNYRELTYNTNGGTFTDTPQTLFFKGVIATLDQNIERAGYTFGGWRQGNTTVTQVDMSTNQTVNAYWTPNTYTLTYHANGGSVSPPSKSVTFNEIYGELPIPTKPGSVFTGWFTEIAGGSVVSANTVYDTPNNQTIYAHWIENATYWSNGNPNGSVSILYHIDNTNVTNDIVTQYPLYRYDSSIADIFETEINESFVNIGYYLNVEINSIRVGANNYDAQAIVSLYDSNNNVIASEIMDFGKWGSFIIKVDTINAVVSYTKVMQFRTFTDYQESDSGVILSYGSYGDFNGLVSQSLKMIPVTNIVPRQSVVNTSVFLNTYGVVLRDPTIDISQYFPEMDEMRLNFYSFALYGESMTVNGHTMNVTAPNITIYYNKTPNGNIIADVPTGTTLTKSLELTNIYITWDGEKCYLTFVNDNFTVDMGTYTDKTVSFEGIWYYATALYEPYTEQEKTYEVDWWGSFDFSTFGIILAGLLILGALTLRVTVGGRALDYVIIVCASIIALIIAGGLVNA